MTPSPFQLLRDGRYHELVARLRDPSARSTFLQEAAAFAGPANGMPVNTADALAERQLDMRSTGDWSWGLLDQQQRRKLLLRDVTLLKGAGVADRGKKQFAALSRLKRELPNLRESLDIALEGGDLDWLLPLAQHLSRIMQLTGESAHTMCERYEALLDVAERLDHDELNMLTQLGLSRSYIALGDYNKGRTSAEAAFEFATRLLPDYQQAEYTGNLGVAEFGRGNLPTAKRLLEISVELSQQSGDDFQSAVSLNHLGIVEYELSDYDASRKAYKAALEIWSRLGNKLYEARSLNNLANVACALGNFREGHLGIERANVINQKYGDLYGVANGCHNLGRLCMRQGDFVQAKLNLERALLHFRELGAVDREALTLCSLGSAEAMQGHYSSAKPYFEQSLALERRLGSSLNLGFVLNNLGKLECLQGNYDGARSLFEESITIATEQGLRYILASIFNNLGQLEQLQGNIRAATTAYLGALKHSTEINRFDGILENCLAAAVILWELRLHDSSITVLYGAQAHANSTRENISADLQESVNTLLDNIAATANNGEFHKTEHSSLKSQAETLSLDELAEFTLKALAEAIADLPPDADAPKDEPTA